MEFRLPTWSMKMDKIEVPDHMEYHPEINGGLFTHKKDQCLGENCTIHNVSDHHMKDWPQNWRGDRRIMERICEHGIGHPDPDDIRVAAGDNVHGCDGCCFPDGFQDEDRMTFNVSLFSYLDETKVIADAIIEYVSARTGFEGTFEEVLVGQWEGFPVATPQIGFRDENGVLVDTIYVGDSVHASHTGIIEIKRKSSNA